MNHPLDMTSLLDMIHAALQEDMPTGDVTTESLGLGVRQGIARLIAKQDMVLSGQMLFEQTMLLLEPDLKIKWSFSDGDFILNRQTLCVVHGDLVQILKAERVALNFLGHLSGIATLTRKFVEQAKHTPTKILDTRKTLPTYRELEKKAVRDGGGTNHRNSLSDAVMIKENHIFASGGMTTAVERVRKNTKKHITVEVQTLDDVKEAVGLQVNRLLLDNMNNEKLAEALKLIPKNIETEASGNMTVDRIKSVAELGVNFISVGALTHSAPTADVSLLFDWKQLA